MAAIGAGGDSAQSTEASGTVLPSAPTGLTVSGLSNGTTYDFTVAAVNAGGNSPASAEAKATPTARKGGGGSLDWLCLGFIATLVLARGAPKP